MSQRQLHLCWTTLSAGRLRAINRFASRLPSIQARLLRSVHVLLTRRELTEGRIHADDLAIDMSASVRSVERARKELVEAGIIEYKPPSKKNLAAGGWYRIAFAAFDDEEWGGGGTEAREEPASQRPATDRAERQPVAVERHSVAAERQAVVLLDPFPPPHTIPPPKTKNTIQPPTSLDDDLREHIERDEAWEDGWRSVELDLIKAGVGEREKAIEHCQRLGIDPGEISELIGWWRAQPAGKWGPGALRRRILDHAPGLDFAANWPPPKKLPTQNATRGFTRAASEKPRATTMSSDEREAVQRLLAMPDEEFAALLSEWERKIIHRHGRDSPMGLPIVRKVARVGGGDREKGRGGEKIFAPSVPLW